MNVLAFLDYTPIPTLHLGPLSCGTSSRQDMTFGPGRHGVAPDSINGSTRCRAQETQR